jgi:hypothetical protein
MATKRSSSFGPKTQSAGAVVERVPSDGRGSSGYRQISEYISKDSLDGSERVVEGSYQAFALLARSPGLGHSRKDLTRKPVLFWSVGNWRLLPGSPH